MRNVTGSKVHSHYLTVNIDAQALAVQPERTQILYLACAYGVDKCVLRSAPALGKSPGHLPHVIDTARIAVVPRHDLLGLPVVDKWVGSGRIKKVCIGIITNGLSDIVDSLPCAVREVAKATNSTAYESLIVAVVRAVHTDHLAAIIEIRRGNVTALLTVSEGAQVGHCIPTLSF